MTVRRTQSQHCVRRSTSKRLTACCSHLTCLCHQAILIGTGHRMAIFWHAASNIAVGLAEMMAAYRLAVWLWSPAGRLLSSRISSGIRVLLLSLEHPLSLSLK